MPSKPPAHPILIDMPMSPARLQVARLAGHTHWTDSVSDWQAPVAPATPAAPPAPKKSAPRGSIPPGPWYAIAWQLLSDSERSRLEHATRQGRPVPTYQDSPVQALSAPSKMPGFSWAITAGRTCPGAVYGTDAICDSCYAGGADHGNTQNANNQRRGYITRLHVRRALLVREQYTRILCATPAGRAPFAAQMVAWIAANTPAADPYFRVHDSGDFFSPSYVDAWRLIAAALPDIRFWAPTRSWHIAADIRARGGAGHRWDAAFAALNALPNVAIRPSALLIGDDAPLLPGWAAGSGVKRSGWNCPASTTNNACRACRQCWDTTTTVYYHAH